MTEPELTELIEQYLLGHLDKDAEQAFERRIAQDPALAEEVGLQRLVFEALRQEPALSDFRQQLAAIEKKMEPVPVAKPLRAQAGARRWLALAAGLLALIVAGWWLTGRTDGASPQVVFRDHFSPPQQLRTASARRHVPIGTASSPDDPWNGLWDVLETQYNRQEWIAALATLQQIKALDPNNDHTSETFFYSGLIHLHHNEPAKALDDLAKVTISHTEDRDWYTALALLALDRKEEAKSYFKKMIAENHPKQKTATEILNKIK